MSYKYLKGPVHSRRLGCSLGINLLIENICSYNCVYCEVGETDTLTTNRKEYVPVEEVIEEIDDFLVSKPELDYITFSGTGEPTLHNKINRIIDYLKDNYPGYKIALLTNGSLFYKRDVINDIKRLDLIVPSLDAASEAVFQIIDRPAENIRLEQVLEGLEKLKKAFNGEIWLEIFIIEGLNDNREELLKFRDIIARINPTRTQLNSLARPAPEEWVKSVSKKRLQEVADFLNYGAEVI